MGATYGYGFHAGNYDFDTDVATARFPIRLFGSAGNSDQSWPGPGRSRQQLCKHFGYREMGIVPCHADGTIGDICGANAFYAIILALRKS